MTVLFFFIGFGLYIFTRTTTYVPLAIIFAPVFILRFLKSHKKGKGILLTVAGFFLSMQIALLNLFDLDGSMVSFVFNLIRNLMLAIALSIPYIAVRMIPVSETKFRYTLLFPMAASSIYFLLSIAGPFDGTGVFYAYTLTGIDSAVQLLSFFGLWGMVFLLSWTASVVEWFWAEGFQVNRIPPGGFISIIAILILFFLGGLRNSPLLYKYEEKTARVGTVVFEVDEEAPSIPELLDNRLFSDLDERFSVIQAYTGQAAASGSDIVVFQEYTMLIKSEDEPAVKNRMAQISRESRIYLVVSYAVLPALLPGDHEIDILGHRILDDDYEEGENKALLFNPEGDLLIEYRKNNLGMGEGAWIKDNTDGITTAETSLGRIALVVCRDLEFPGYMRQAARDGADIVIAPSYEMIKSLAVSHGQMKRAVEYGFSLVRPVYYGLSFAADYKGNILSTHNCFTSTERIMYADIPIKGKKTLYTRIGDIVPFLSMAGFVLIAFFRLFKGPVKFIHE